MEKMGLEACLKPLHGMFSFFYKYIVLTIKYTTIYVHHPHHQHHLNVQQPTEQVSCLNSIHLGKFFYSSFSLYLMHFLLLATGTGMTTNGHAYHPCHHVRQPWIPLQLWLLHQCPLFFLPPSIPQPANIPILPQTLMMAHCIPGTSCTLDTFYNGEEGLPRFKGMKEKKWKKTGLETCILFPFLYIVLTIKYTMTTYPSTIPTNFTSLHPTTNKMATTIKKTSKPPQCIELPPKQQ